MLYGMMF